MSEAEVAQKVKEFLEQMDLKFEHIEDKNVFVVPFFSEKTGKHFNVIITIKDDWVTTAAIAVSREELPRDIDEKELYRLLLLMTFELNEVTFGLTHKGDVVVHAESHVKALSFENFRVEFGSVVFGVEFFHREILPNYPRVKVPDYYSKLIYLA